MTEPLDPDADPGDMLLDMIGFAAGIYVDGGTIRNTILTSNSAAQNPDVGDANAGNAVSLGHNLFSSPAGLGGLSAGDRIVIADLAGAPPAWAEIGAQVHFGWNADAALAYSANSMP